MDEIRIQEATIEKHGKAMQTFVAIEEMSELIKELVKDMRGADNREAIIEELADVYITLWQIEIMHFIELNEVKNMINKKMERMAERLDNDESV